MPDFVDLQAVLPELVVAAEVVFALQPAVAERMRPVLHSYFQTCYNNCRFLFNVVLGLCQFSPRKRSCLWSR